MRILRGAGSALLPCGCFVGLYETYSGPTVQIVEERGASCSDARHEPGAQIALTPANLTQTRAEPPTHRSAA